VKCGVCRIARSLRAIVSAEEMGLERERFRRLEGPDGVQRVVAMVDEATDDSGRRNAVMVAMNEPGRVVLAWNRELRAQLRSWFRAVSRL
jgi:hypothetical protein